MTNENHVRKGSINWWQRELGRCNWEQGGGGKGRVGTTSWTRSVRLKQLTHVVGGKMSECKQESKEIQTHVKRDFQINESSLYCSNPPNYLDEKKKTCGVM